MAHHLLRLGRHLERSDYQTLAATLLAQVQALAAQEPQHLTNWASLYAALLRPGAEVAIVGPQAEDFRRQLGQHFLPHNVLAGSLGVSGLPLLRGRGRDGKTTIYVCRDRTCQLPVHSVAEALAQLGLAGE